MNLPEILAAHARWRIRAATRFGSVALSVSRKGRLTVAVEGTAEQEAAVLGALRGIL